MLALTCKSMMELLRAENYYAAANTIFQAQVGSTLNESSRFRFKEFRLFERTRYLHKIQMLVPWEYALCNYCWKYKICTQESQGPRPWLTRQSKIAREPTRMCPSCIFNPTTPTIRQFFARMPGTVGLNWVESGREERRRRYENILRRRRAWGPNNGLYRVDNVGYFLRSVKSH